MNTASQAQDSFNQRNIAGAMSQCSSLTSSTNPVYDLVQADIGGPKEPQVNTALENLREAIDYHEELVAAVMRRLEPVTGERAPFPKAESPVKPPRVFVASRIEVYTDRLRESSADLLWAIKALEI